MELLLIRDYYPQGTNGVLYIKGQPAPLCYTIELPWQNNAPQSSCIPEGRYTVQERYNEKFKTHLHIPHVPGREGILIHPANDALKELRGCIAPVTILTANGRGIQSRKACEKLYAAVKDALDNNDTLLLTIVPITYRGEQITVHENNYQKSESKNAALL